MNAVTASDHMCNGLAQRIDNPGTIPAAQRGPFLGGAVNTDAVGSEQQKRWDANTSGKL